MIMGFILPPELRARLLQERRKAQKAADVFARVCEDGDAAMLCDAAQLLNECVGAWRRAMAKVAILARVRPEVQNAFLDVWIESKTLRPNVGSRPVLAAALRVLFPCNYSGPSLTLNRGAGSDERRRRLYGFAWTTDIDVARKFAGKEAAPAIKVTDAYRTIEALSPALEAVILQTLAPPEAILLIRKPENYYDEEEVIVDPFRLGKIKVIEGMRGQRGFLVTFFTATGLVHQLIEALDERRLIKDPKDAGWDNAARRAAYNGLTAAHS